MKNLLITILTVLVMVIMIIAMKSGINAGLLHIPGFQGIADENQNLLNMIDQANEKSNEYTDKIKTINNDAEKLASAKKEYFDLVQVSTDSEIQEAMQIKSYKVEYLWSRVGNHATKDGVKVKMEIVPSNMGNSEYKNLKFTANGTYLAITNFIYDIENDTNLDFTIDEFDMKSNVATFTVKDVKIIEEQLTNSEDEKIEAKNTTNANDTSDNNVSNYTEEEKERAKKGTNVIVNMFTPDNAERN